MMNVFSKGINFSNISSFSLFFKMLAFLLAEHSGIPQDEGDS